MPSSKPRKTKLIATIGPACDSIETLKAMIRAGMNVARLNFSHGSHEEHRKRLDAIRQASADLGENVAVMLDTKGLEIRTGRVQGGSVALTTGQLVASGSNNCIETFRLAHDQIAHACQLGRFGDLFRVWLRFKSGNVLGNCSVEKPDILGDISDHPATALSCPMR